MAWTLSKQVTLALDCLHANGMTHAVAPNQGRFSDPNFLGVLGDKHVTEDLYVRPGHQITQSFPRFTVEPVKFPIPATDDQIHATLIDFEQAFFHTDQTLARVRTPLVYRAPETLLDFRWDLRMDIWSLAYTIFALVTGQPPFDNFMPTKPHLVLEWIATCGEVPDEWEETAKLIVGDHQAEISGGCLADYLMELYFDEEKTAEFTRKAIERLGDLLTRMMRYRPKERLST